MPVADPHKVVLTGENPFLRLSEKDGDPNSTDASYWRILFSPMGPGHVLYLKSELTGGQWRIYSDNIALALQARQGWARPLSRRQKAELAEGFIKSLDIRPADPDRPRSSSRPTDRSGSPADGARSPRSPAGCPPRSRCCSRRA